MQSLGFEIGGGLSTQGSTPYSTYQDEGTAIACSNPSDEILSGLGFAP